MTQRENMIRVIQFERPEFIPVNFCVSKSTGQTTIPYLK